MKRAWHWLLVVGNVMVVFYAVRLTITGHSGRLVLVWLCSVAAIGAVIDLLSNLADAIWPGDES